MEYLLLGKELKVHANIGKKQYQGLDKAFISDNDNKNVTVSLIKKEPVAETITKNYILS